MSDLPSACWASDQDLLLLRCSHLRLEWGPTRRSSRRCTPSFCTACHFQRRGGSRLSGRASARKVALLHRDPSSKPCVKEAACSRTLAEFGGRAEREPGEGGPDKGGLGW